MIKLFEQFNNEQEIHDICKKYKIMNYTINPDGSIDVDDDVIISNKGLKNIPLKFNRVSGHFTCSRNNLTSLEGCPIVVGGNFYCYQNDLVTLLGSPKFIGGEFKCYQNILTSLEGCPEEIEGNFDCSENYLESLVCICKRINGDLNCDDNNITSLEGFPIIISGNLFIFNNPISIIDSSIEVKDDINIDDTNFDDKIKSLSQDKLRILFEHGVDYDIFRKDGSINDSRLERMFKDFNI